VGKRWTGAIVHVLFFTGPLRFSEIAQNVPELSDRLLSQRMKELESRGLVERRVLDGSPVRVQYALTPMGRDLGPALGEIKAWARRWLREPGRGL
jgi:DNA-binding HxlR family transcriptional regulator